MKLRVVLLLFGLLTLSSICSETAIELTMGHFANENHPGNIASRMFADSVRRRTNGAVNITVFPNNQLGDPIDVIEKNLGGVIDMSLPAQGQLSAFSKKFTCLSIPFLFDGYDEVYEFLDGPFTQWVGSEIEEQGLVFLSNWEWGYRNITNNIRPVYAPEDVEGLTIRTPPELANQVLMNGLGAEVKTIAWPELPMALKQRVVDGQENPIPVIYSYRIYETQRFLTMTRHIYNSMAHVISKKTWDRLSQEHRTIIREESIKAGNFMRRSIQVEERKQLEELEALGMHIIWPDREEFKKSIPDVYEILKMDIGEETYYTFMNMVEEFKNR